MSMPSSGSLKSDCDTASDLTGTVVCCGLLFLPCAKGNTAQLLFVGRDACADALSAVPVSLASPVSYAQSPARCAKSNPARPAGTAGSVPRVDAPAVVVFICATAARPSPAVSSAAHARDSAPRAPPAGRPLRPFRPSAGRRPRVPPPVRPRSRPRPPAVRPLLAKTQSETRQLCANRANKQTQATFTKKLGISSPPPGSVLPGLSPPRRVHPRRCTHTLRAHREHARLRHLPRHPPNKKRVGSEWEGRFYGTASKREVVRAPSSSSKTRASRAGSIGNRASAASLVSPPCCRLARMRPSLTAR